RSPGKSRDRCDVALRSAKDLVPARLHADRKFPSMFHRPNREAGSKADLIIINNSFPIRSNRGLFLWRGPRADCSSVNAHDSWLSAWSGGGCRFIQKMPRRRHLRPESCFDVIAPTPTCDIARNAPKG